MRIAILGAGLSGLCCAISLQKSGIEPVVYERRSEVGDRFVNAEVMLGILDRPITDQVAYLGDRHGIYFQPAGNIRKLTAHTDKEKGSIRGNLGFITIRGRHENALEKQLAQQYRGKIHFNSTVNYEDLLHDFTHVVLATGDAAYAAKVQDVDLNLTVTLKGATVVGDFNPQQVHVWLNNRYAPQGYGYLIPYSSQEANLVIGYPDYPHNRHRSLKKMWQTFYHQAKCDLKQDLPVTDQFEVTRYIISKSRYTRIGNTFMVGNCLCSPMPALGFGQFPSMLSGVYAAQHLLGRGDYIKLTEGLYRSYHRSLILRRLQERFGNRDYDRLVRLFRTNLANQLLNTRVNFMGLTALILEPWVSIANWIDPKNN